MADYRNPNDPYEPGAARDPASPREVGYKELDRAGGGNWGWIVGGLVALFLVFAFIFGFSGDNRMAATDNPVTTGQSSPATTGRATDTNTGAAPRDVTPRAPAPAAPAPAPAPQGGTAQ